MTTTTKEEGGYLDDNKNDKIIKFHNLTTINVANDTCDKWNINPTDKPHTCLLHVVYSLCLPSQLERAILELSVSFSLCFGPFSFSDLSVSNEVEKSESF